MIQTLNKESINKIELGQLSKEINEPEFKNYFLGEPGEEHYKLLGYISSNTNDSILLDIGTYKGCSALALSINLTNTVKSFDVRSGLVNINNVPSNIEFILDDITNGNYKELILSSNFIILDTDHDGSFEQVFYSYIKSINWKGSLLIDDIKLNDPMSVFWDTIIEEKYDISHIGHHSGTGLVIFK
tara:strand:+ start:920 stop:1477 length:558 start_codon:yes stop_codon:yes gene_type:complete